MRFYRWTRDFTPKAQAQTHAQIWVRFLHLPQEYWGKQTLSEIASGLGTPLAIDEATQNRRFGLFARVLIDVNMNDQMFESVIVEREGHALTIMVQYEKYPPFCSHCKAIGHSIQACSKMNVDSNALGTKKTHKVNHKFQPKYDLIANEPTKLSIQEGASNGIGKQSSPAHGSKSGKALDHGDIHELPYVSADDFEEGGISAPECTNIALQNAPQDSVPNQNSNDLTLHNSFKWLENGTKQVIGDAKTRDEASIPILMDMYIDKNPIGKDISLRKEDLTHNTLLDSTGNCVNRNSNSVNLGSSNPLLGPVNGKKTSLITGPSSSAQGSISGRPFPIATNEPLVIAEDPFFDDAITLEPVTLTNEILGPDKRKVQLTVGPKNQTAACLKDGKVLRKFWGDEDTDSTYEPDIETDVYRANSHFPDASHYLDTPCDKMQKSKRGRPKKQKSPIHLNGTQTQQTSYTKQSREVAHTRSQAGSKNPDKSNISQ